MEKKIPGSSGHLHVLLPPTIMIHRKVISLDIKQNFVKYSFQHNISHNFKNPNFQLL